MCTWILFPLLSLCFSETGPNPQCTFLDTVCVHNSCFQLPAAFTAPFICQAPLPTRAQDTEHNSFLLPIFLLSAVAMASIKLACWAPLQLIKDIPQCFFLILFLNSFYQFPKREPQLYTGITVCKSLTNNCGKEPVFRQKVGKMVDSSESSNLKR